MSPKLQRCADISCLLQFESLFRSIETARISTIATGFTKFSFKVRSPANALSASLILKAMLCWRAMPTHWEQLHQYPIFVDSQDCKA